MRFSQLLVAAASLGYAAAQSVIVEGATTGGVQSRKNLNTLCSRNDPERTMYFRALQRMMAADMDDPMSYFQIAGVHGRPYTSWDGVGQVGGGTGRGYCLHSDIGFLPWHRAYLSAFEQSLIANAIEIANEYPTSVRGVYLSAAQNLRAPYWDWAADYRIPDCASASSISVFVPAGSSVTSQSISNPLLSFRFPSGAASRFGSIVDSGLDASRTQRCGASAANAELSGDNLKDQVYSAFTRSTSFAALSVGTSSTVMALEQPHNAVHVDAGCGNHFSTVGAAGFDPLFMLHHCNVDRLWAIWQEIYSTAIPSGSTTGGSWSIGSGSSFSSNTALSPFRRTAGSYWTPSQLYDTTNLGYSYADIDVSASSSTRRSNAIAVVNQLYSPTGSGSGGSGPLNPRRPPNPRRPTARRLARRAEDADSRRFFAKITVDTNKLPTMPISIKFYIDDVIAGSYTLLNAPADTIAKGEVPLHRVLADQGYHDSSLTPDEIEDQIEAKLKIVFLNPDDSVIEPTSVEGACTFEVESAELIPNLAIDQLPSYGQSRRKHVEPDLLNVAPTLSYEKRSMRVRI